MLTFVLILVATLIVLGLLFGLGDKSEDDDENGNGGSKPLALLPGDVKYESPSGNFRFYFPITTSIVLSIVLTLVLKLFG